MKHIIGVGCILIWAICGDVRAAELVSSAHGVTHGPGRLLSPQPGKGVFTVEAFRRSNERSYE